MVTSSDHNGRRDLGRRIKNLLVIKGWTQSELARKSGIAEGTLSKIVNGEIGTSAEHIYRLAEALDTVSSQLMGETKTILLKEDSIPAEVDPDLLELAKERHKQKTPSPADILLSLARMRFRGERPGKSFYAFDMLEEVNPPSTKKGKGRDDVIDI